MNVPESRSVNIRLDISVPVGAGEVQVQGQPYKGTYGPPDITHPNDGGTTLIKQINGRWYMCATGNCSHRHVFARVYNGTESPPNDPAEGPDTLWDKPEQDGVWRFDLLPVPDGAGSKKIAVWGDTGSIYERQVYSFTAVASTYTYCETYGLTAEAAKAKKPTAKDWSLLPDRWQFQIAGVSNASSCNCVCLNGTWLLKREGGALLWHRKLESSFADPKRPSYWRLSFNQKDGFWYLECVGDLAQPAGISIVYRRHESAWDPCGANELLLLTNHGYCNAPDFVTLYPA